MRKIWKTAVLAYIGGMLYVLIELMWRGWSHPSMFLVGGVCFALVGGLSGGTRDTLPLSVRALAGAVVVTAIELCAGLIVNVGLGWNVWDYSHLPLNFMGQICLYFFLLWIPLAGIAVIADGLLRHALFGEKMPVYRWF